jgi:hypothetical protein
MANHSITNSGDGMELDVSPPAADNTKKIATTAWVRGFSSCPNSCTTTCVSSTCNAVQCVGFGCSCDCTCCCECSCGSCNIVGG